MATAYVDSSTLLAIAFNEEGGVDVRQQLAEFDRRQRSIAEALGFQV